MSQNAVVRGADRAARTALKYAAAAVDVVRRPADGFVILLYHRVGGGTDSRVDLPRALFDRQMASLAAGGRVASLDDVLAGLARKEHAPRVAVTFDDGTADLVDVALPILVRHRVPATFYIATSFIEEQSPFPGGAPPLSWAALREAESTGLVSVGSHTHTHCLLDRAPSTEAAAELDRSIDLIATHLGHPPADFAYPKALLGSEPEVRSRFRSAALAGTIANVAGHTDVYRLARSPVQVGDGLRWFERKATGGMGLEDRLRGLANRRRYAAISS